MANSGQSAFGATLTFTNGTAATTTAITQITKVGFSGGSIGKIDISSMSGTKTKEYISGMIEPGQFTVDCNFDSAQYTALAAVVGVPSSTFVMRFNDGTAVSNHSRFSATGYLEPLNFDGPMDGAPITQTLTITLSGAVTYTAKT
jgi:hypothetical protein